MKEVRDFPRSKSVKGLVGEDSLALAAALHSESEEAGGSRSRLVRFWCGSGFGHAVPYPRRFCSPSLLARWAVMNVLMSKMFFGIFLWLGFFFFTFWLQIVALNPSVQEVQCFIKSCN